MDMLKSFYLNHANNPLKRATHISSSVNGTLKLKHGEVKLYNNLI